jgi:NTP pyrophosphatase (non-canonical NTP hydrolase)
MEHYLSILYLTLQVLVLAATLVGIVLGGTRWGKTQQGKQAKDLAELVALKAGEVVHAVEQRWKGCAPPSGMSAADLNLQKRAEAVADLTADLSAFGAHPDLVGALDLGKAIEAAVGKMNVGKVKT